MIFESRQAAGKMLAKKLFEYKSNNEMCVMAIPRGGVVTGAEIAEQLNLPLEAISIKKLGAPFNPELAIGAVAQNNTKYIDRDLIAKLAVTEEYLERETEEKMKEVEERVFKYKINLNSLTKHAKFILTDDGIATGATVRAALTFIQNLSKLTGVKRWAILAIPVAAKDTAALFKNEADKIIILHESEDFGAVGQFYRNFSQVEDEEVINILEKYRRK